MAATAGYRSRFLVSRDPAVKARTHSIAWRCVNSERRPRHYVAKCTCGWETEGNYGAINRAIDAHLSPAKATGGA